MMHAWISPGGDAPARRNRRVVQAQLLARAIVAPCTRRTGAS